MDADHQAGAAQGAGDVPPVTHPPGAPLGWGQLARLAGSGCPDLLAVIDDATTILWANHRSNDVLGRTPRELAGSTVLDLLHPDDVGLAASVLASAALAQPEYRPARYRLRHAQGHWVDVEAMGVATTLPDGRGAVVVSARTFGGRVVDVLASLASGRDLADVADDILEVFLSSREGTATLISWHDEPDVVRLRSVGDATPEVIEALAAVQPLAAVGEPAQVVDLDHLAPAVRDAARTAGFAGYVTLAVEDPAGCGDACITLWSSDDRILEMLALGAIREPAWALRLALQQRHYRRRLEHAAGHDPLTGLANRARLFEELARHVGGTDATSVLYLDLDEFKPVNDDHGHHVGDEVLLAAAGRLRSTVRGGDLVARVGGDEFVVVCPATGADDAAALADRLLAEVSRPVVVDDRRLDVTVSIGVATAAGPQDPDALVAAADAAMYEAKRAGRAAWRAAPPPR